MISPNVNHISPEIWLATFVNTHSAMVSKGYAMFWDYLGTATNTVLPGKLSHNDARYGRTNIANLVEPLGLYAGHVVRRDVHVGDHGWIQCYGEVDGVPIGNVTVAADTTWIPMLTQFDNASLKDHVLRPVCGFATGATYAGCLGIQKLPGYSTVTSQLAHDHDLHLLQPGGYAVPVGDFKNETGVGGTTATNSVTAATGVRYARVFVKCL